MWKLAKHLPYKLEDMSLIQEAHKKTRCVCSSALGKQNQEDPLGIPGQLV